MPNIAAVLKDEVLRIARKEVRQQLQALQKSAALHRREIAALKRRLHDAERDLKKVGKAAKSASPAQNPEGSDARVRFSAKGFASLRKRLGLSAADMGRLIGASGLSVYKWEGGAQPRPQYITAIAAIRGLGKREAAKRLEAVHA